MADNPKIGDLNRRIVIGRRDKAQNINDPGTHYVLTPMAEAWAHIQPLGTALMINSMGVEPQDTITHRITTYWLDIDTETFDLVQHTRSMPDNTLRTETFKIVRVTEWQGQRVYLIIDARLENVDT